MIFSTQKDMVLYLQKLLDANISVGLMELNKVLKYNNAVISKTTMTQTDETDISLNKIDIVDEQLCVVLNAPSWINTLPSIYHDNKFLQNFLFGLQTLDLKHQNTIDQIENQFHPSNTDFIDWLSTWVGVGFSSEVEDRDKRRVLNNIVSLYKKRGTKSYFVDLIYYLSGAKVIIDDDGEKEILHGSLFSEKNTENVFKVYIQEKLSEDKEDEKKKLQIINDIITIEKPVHTSFSVEYPFGDHIVESSNTKVIDMHYDDNYDYDSLKE